MSTRTVLALVRHGQATSNREGRFGGHGPAELTDLGVAQAGRAGAALAALEPSALISSDLVRARQTAEHIAAHVGLDVALDPRLRERGLGELDGLTFAEAADRHPEVWRQLIDRDPTVHPPGGESLDMVYERVSAAVDHIVAEHAGHTVVVVSHGLALFHAFSHVCGLGSPAQGHQVFVLVDNASITRVEHERAGEVDRWRIRTVNETSHLGD